MFKPHLLETSATFWNKHRLISRWSLDRLSSSRLAPIVTALLSHSAALQSQPPRPSPSTHPACARLRPWPVATGCDRWVRGAGSHGRASLLAYRYRLIASGRRLLRYAKASLYCSITGRLRQTVSWSSYEKKRHLRLISADQVQSKIQVLKSTRKRSCKKEDSRTWLTCWLIHLAVQTGSLF